MKNLENKKDLGLAFLSKNLNLLFLQSRILYIFHYIFSVEHSLPLNR